MTTTDELHQQIIDAATKGHALYQAEDEATAHELSPAFQEALARVQPYAGVVMMAIKLLGGSPYSILSGNPESIKLYIAIANKLGATVENDEGGGGFAGVIEQPGSTMRSIVVRPASVARQSQCDEQRVDWSGIKALGEGVHARKDGKPRDACPYSDKTLADLWLRGWGDRDETNVENEDW